MNRKAAKPYLVCTDPGQRRDFVRTTRHGTKHVAVYNQVPLGELATEFTATICLRELYDDQTFLKFLATVDADTTLYYVDLGLDYCSFKGDYIAPFLRLHPLFQQAGATYIIDAFAFYNTEKAIFRPFLYIDEHILDATVQQFYNQGTYKDYTGNRIEEYLPKVAPYIDLRVQSLQLEVVQYKPTRAELAEYERLKFDLVMVKHYPKAKVVRLLLDYIAATKTRMKAEVCPPQGSMLVKRNDARNRVAMYRGIHAQRPRSVVFYSSKAYGADEQELQLTLGALTRHNRFIELYHAQGI